MPDCGVHYLWFAFVCFLIRSPPPQCKYEIPEDGAAGVGVDGLPLGQLLLNTVTRGERRTCSASGAQEEPCTRPQGCAHHENCLSAARAQRNDLPVWAEPRIRGTVESRGGPATNPKIATDVI